MEIAARECGKGDPGVEIQFCLFLRGEQEWEMVWSLLRTKLKSPRLVTAMLVKQSLGRDLYGINRILMMFVKFLEA